jgi:hypothetical protein
MSAPKAACNLMNHYSFNLEDYTKTSWAFHEVVKLAPKRARPAAMPSVFYKFFPAADVEVRMKPQYHHLCCKKCGRYESDKVFEIGFDDPVTMQFKGDYGHTNDRMFVINDKFLKVLKQAKVSGYETKPLGKSGWHALRATLLIDHIAGVVKTQKPLCAECGRPKENFGIFEYRSQLSLPSQPNTFFSTKSSWPSYHFCDRQIFISEDVLRVLRGAGISGGYCTRLWTDEELQKQKAKAKQGTPFWRPPQTAIPLNGKPLKGEKAK